jgi:proton glutamate symport protein
MKRISLTSWIFIAMAGGIAIGHFWPEFGKDTAFLATIFLRLIKSIIAPLLFATLVVGIAGSGSAKAMGRIGLKALIYFNVTTIGALALALLSVNYFKPGLGVSLEGAGKAEIPEAKASLIGVLVNATPTSVLDAMARNEVLQLVVFTVLFGMACIAMGERADPVVRFCRSLSDVMFEYTRYVMYLAPVGVGAAIASVVGAKGIGVLLGLGKLIGSLYIALLGYIVLVMGPAALLFRIPVLRFLRAAKDPYILAFSTASSEAAFPMAMRNMERFGVPRHIVSFVLPTGYSFNLDGSTLYLALASVFVAQAAGVDLSLTQQLTMIATLMLTSKGVAAVPRASLVILAATLSTFNLPLEGVALILGVDTLMDMGRTSVNLLGNCLATAAVARWEGYDLVAREEKPEDSAAPGSAAAQTQE